MVILSARLTIWILFLFIGVRVTEAWGETETTSKINPTAQTTAPSTVQDKRMLRDFHYGVYGGFADTPVIAFGVNYQAWIFALALKFRYDANGTTSFGGDLTPTKFSYGASFTVSYMFRNETPLALGPELTFYGVSQTSFLDYRYWQPGLVLWYLPVPTVPILVGVSLATRFIHTDTSKPVLEIFTPAIRLGFGIN